MIATSGFSLTDSHEPLRLDRLRKYQIVSLWDMKEIVGYQLVHTVKELTHHAIVCESTFSEDYTKIQGAMGVLGEARNCCYAIGLSTSLQEADELLAIKQPKIQELGRNLKHLTQTIERESRQFQYLVIDPEYTKLFHSSAVATLSAELTDLRIDLREAQLCLALNRTTACVFHLCLVMEFATEKLREKVGAPKGPNGTMGEMATEIEKVVTGWGRKPETRPKQIRDQYQAAIWPLKSFVKGLRNQELHRNTLGEVYKQEEARALLHTVVSFLNEITPLLKLSL